VGALLVGEAPAPVDELWTEEQMNIDIHSGTSCFAPSLSWEFQLPKEAK
jgi:hypothetical protein